MVTYRIFMLLTPFSVIPSDRPGIPGSGESKTLLILYQRERPGSIYLGSGGKCVNSLFGDGCSIEGVVENSILFPGVTVEAGAGPEAHRPAS